MIDFRFLLPNILLERSVVMKYERIAELVMGYIITRDTAELAKLKMIEIASYFDLNRSYLSKKFHQESRWTVLQFIHFEKMKRSEELIRTRFDLSVEAIALMVGITDIRRFRSEFKATYGMNPGIYRAFYRSDVFKKRVSQQKSTTIIHEKERSSHRRYYVGNKRVVSIMPQTGAVAGTEHRFL